MQLMSPQEILDRAQLIHSTEVIQETLARLSEDIAKVLHDECPVMICVMGGGLIFAGQLLTRFQFPLQLDYLHASRYQNQTVGSKTLAWHVLPKSSLKDRTVLLLDDILDEGITLKEIKDKCLELGAKRVLSAVLVEKKLDHQKPINADFVGLEVPNHYVFGYGMDAYGWWRNLPAIYYLQE
jgi:hypoxanthine phosphoribosyltransferase